MIGGRPREVSIEIDPARLASARVDPLHIVDVIGRANVRTTAAGPIDGTVSRLEAGSHLASAHDVRNVIVSADRG